MTSDEKRREVARALRNNLKYMIRKEGWYGKDLDPNACGNAAYRNIAASVEDCGNLIDGNYIHIVELVADLIDRTTCRNVSGCQDTFECSECGCRAELVTEVRNEHGDPFHVPLMPSFCHNCGAMVAEEDGRNVREL